MGCDSSIETFDNLIKGSSQRPLNSSVNYGEDVVIPFSSEKRLLFQLIKGNADPRMPFQKDSLGAGDINTIKEWIDNGAKKLDG